MNNEAPKPDSDPPADHSDATGADTPSDRPSPTELPDSRHGPEEELTATTHQHLADVADAYRRLATAPFLEVMQRHDEAVRAVGAAVGVGKLYGDVVRAFAPAAKLAPQLKGSNAVLAAGLGRELNAVLGGGRWAEVNLGFAAGKAAAASLVQLGQRHDEAVRAVGAAVGVGVGKLYGDVVRAFAPAAKLAFAGPHESIHAYTIDDRVVELARLDAKRQAAAYRADAAIPELLNLTERQAQILDKMSAAITELNALTRTAHAQQQTDATFNRRIQIAILLATLVALLFSALGYAFPRDAPLAQPEPAPPSTSVGVSHIHPTQGGESPR